MGQKREDQAGAQDVTGHSTEADLSFGNGRLTTSNTEMVTHLGNKEVSTSAFVETEAVKEETIQTNTKAIERTILVRTNFSRRLDEGET